jgi:hypothetical protein
MPDHLFANVDDLAGHAAEAIFAKTQPYRYSKYLEFANRMDEAMAVARKLTDGGPAREQAWAWAQISNLLTLRDIQGFSCEEIAEIEKAERLS